MSLYLVFCGKDAQMSAELDPAKAILLGRGTRCDLVVDHPTVSRRHAELSMESERLILEDLKSANGTFVNDVRTVRDVVRPGDRVRLGSADLVLLLGGTSLGNLDDVRARELCSSGDEAVLSGVAEALTPVDLVQVLAANGKSGTLMLFKGRFGRIDFKKGNVCYARVDRVEGVKAFHRILNWDGAEFQFRSLHPEQENIDAPTDRLLIDQVRYHEEMQTLETILPDPETELTCKPGGVSGSFSEIEDAILLAASEARKLIQVMDSSPYLDVEIARSVARLIQAGVIAPVIRTEPSGS
jgi:hypothetical protein